MLWLRESGDGAEDLDVRAFDDGHGRGSELEMGRDPGDREGAAVRRAALGSRGHARVRTWK